MGVRFAHWPHRRLEATLRRALLASPEESSRRAAGELPMPSPWAAGVALLALLGFGVFVGSILGGSPQSAPTVLLAARGAPASSQIKPPATPPASSPASEASTETPEAQPEAQTTTTTTVSAQQPSGKQGEGSAPKASKGESPSPGSQLPPVHHVFLIVLSDEGESAAFGSGSQARYLSKTLRAQGELIEGYYAVSKGELANGIALVSGQGPTPQTAEDCPSFADLAPGTAGKLGQALGSGCVYPSSTRTLANQLADEGKTWRAYVEGMDGGGAAEGGPQTCEHPALGAPDGSAGANGLTSAAGSTAAAGSATAGDSASAGGYVSWRNPFVYFHALIDGRACAEDDVGLQQLSVDLKSESTTPSFAYIVPSLCDDGSQQPCAPGKPAGLPAADGFLRQVVPEIERSAAYKQGGLIAITFDQAPQSGPQADSSGCCMSSAFPNMPANGSSSESAPAPTESPSTRAQTSTGSPSTSAPATEPSPSASPAESPAGATPSGGGKVGLLLISKYVKPASFNATGQYNHFSLLRSIEDLLGVQPLSYAAESGLLAFDASVFNAWHG